MLKNKKLLSNCFRYFSPGNFVSKKIFSRSYAVTTNTEEFTLTPEYPPIEVNGNDQDEEKKQADNRDKIKRQGTVEEKIFVVNTPRFWGWKCFMIREGVIPFNNLCFTQHTTRTHLIKCDELPGHYHKSLNTCSRLAKELKNKILDSIEYQLHIRNKQLYENLDDGSREKEITKIIVSEINRTIINNLSLDMAYLKSMQVDYTPRIEAFWEVNSLTETCIKKEYKYGIPWEELPEEYLERPSDKFMQYIGQPILQLRHALPLPSLMHNKEADIFNYSVPVFTYDPHVVLGYEMNRRHVTNIPGFWPGDDREFSFLSYHCLNHIAHRPSVYGEEDVMQAIQSQLIFASFGWLISLACYKGFSVYNDITYPLMTQSVATNGQKFIFAAYQLNTIETHFKNTYGNPKCNICWVSSPMNLWEEYVNGKIKGFNEKTLQVLLQFYVNQPQPMRNISINPYLSKSAKYIADYEDDEKREWLEERFKHLSANKPPSRPDLMYEVQDWERIFKIQFRMRPRDARKRPFELMQNPYHKKMTSVKGKYIPKCLRQDKHLPKWKQKKFASTFYPE